MSTDVAAILELIKAIGSLAYDAKNEGFSLNHTARKELVKNAERLAIVAREPEENLYFQATQTAQNSALRTAVGMGVFDKIPHLRTGISATELSTALNVDERLLVRIMRACTSTHLFDEVSPSRYTHNAFSAIFLKPANRDMFVQMYDFLGQGVYAMPHFLASTKYQNPASYHKGAFQFAHRTDLGFWEYLKEDPERMKVFNSGMRSLATVGGAAKSAGPYLFEKELEREIISHTDVTVVDVGGGRGQALEAIKTVYPGIKGRMLLQDVPSVIEDAKAGGLPRFVETMPVSFFEPQPVRGALIYHFRRIFHDWADSASVSILRNTALAMTAQSRILIFDTIVPDVNAPRHIALQDINMMSFGGTERTQSQWVDLLEKAGLQFKRVWTAEGNLMGVVEAVLRGFEHQ